MTCPNTSGFQAYLDNYTVLPSKLTVSGSVETNGGDHIPHLRVREPQGINPKILLLELTIESTGLPGTDDVAYRPLSFETHTAPLQYDSICIFYGVEKCVEMDVIERTAVYGSATYEARWVQRSNIIRLTASGILPCYNYDAELVQRPERVSPPQWNLVFLTEPVCWKALKPFTIKTEFPGIDGQETVMVIDASEENEIPILPAYNEAESMGLLATASVSDMYSVHALSTDDVKTNPTGCQIVPSDWLVAAIYTRVFGPAPKSDCDKFVSDKCSAADSNDLSLRGGEIPWPLFK